VALPEHDEVVGAVEVARRLEVARATVDQWRQRSVLPDPRWQVGGRPAWSWAEVRAWAERTGRLDSSKAPPP
jgi:predicted DNA-binding transcriptional regulator AlpA